MTRIKQFLLFCLCFATCFLNCLAQVCDSNAGNGCANGGFLTGHSACTFYKFTASLLFCGLDLSDYYPDNSGCVALTATPTAAPQIAATGLTPAQFCDQFSIDCCGAPTVSPTLSPSASPSVSPSQSPSKSPTGSPSKLPSVSPTRLPSASPTTNPTRSPQVPVPGFFEVEENVYMVSGIGGGLAFVIVAALAIRALRKRRQNPMSPSTRDEPKTQPELRGKKGVTPSMKVKIEQEVENSIFDWEKHIDKTSGEVYFFNPKTNESRWDPPEIVSQTIKNISSQVEKRI